MFTSCSSSSFSSSSFSSLSFFSTLFSSLYRVIKVAKQFIDKLSFAVSDKQTFSAELAALGLDSSKDVVAGLYDAKGQKFAMEESFSVDNLKTFAQQYLDGELEPYIKSEPIPEDSGPVKVM